MATPSSLLFYVRLLMSVDKKCARGERERIIVKSAYVLSNFVCVSYLCNKMHVTVSALLPHLLEEPIWVPGLPCGLFTAQLDMAPQWTPFLTVLVSRLRRIRSSLSAMDSNMRISSDEVTFFARHGFCKKLLSHVNHCLLL
jgi:hypothetical protein